MKRPGPAERWGERIFRIALALLLRELPPEWEEELLQVFRMRQKTVRQRWTVLALPILWAREVADLALAGLRMRRPDAWARRTLHPPPSGHETSEPTTPRHLMDQLAQDLRFAFRTFLRRPGMTGLAVLSLALGIGASTAMFSVVDSVLLRPLPFPEPEEIVSVYPSNPSFRGHPTFDEFADRGTFSLPEVHWVAENQQAFEHFGAYIGYSGVTLSGGDGPPRQLTRVLATPGLLAALGVEPLRGRLLSIEEDDPRTGARSVLLTESFWTARYQRDPGTVGSTIRLDDEPHTIVGILPERVKEATNQADVWRLMTGTSTDGNWGNHNVSGAVGRLADGVSLEQARQEVARLMEAAPPESNHGHGASVYPRLEDRTRQARPALLALIAGAFVLLAVGCGNVASILIGAGIDREQEIAVRGAVGADRGRLARQLLTESLALAGAGALGGVLVADLVSRSLLFLAPPNLPRIDQVGLDGRVLAFAIVVSLAAGVLFGLAPALSLSRPDLAKIIKSGRGGTRGRSRAQAGVVVGELALATVLLVSAALLGRTLYALNTVELGLDPDGLYAVRLALPYQRFDQEDPDERQAALDGYFQELVDAVRTVPGVRSLAVTSNVPLTGDRSNNDVTPEGWDAEQEGEVLLAERRFVSEGYFETIGIRLVEGRPFEAADNRSGSAPVMILSEGLARRVWPEDPAVGKQVSFWGRDPSNVVGVVEDLRDESLDQSTRYAFYVPARQIGAQVGSLVMRLEGDPASVVPAIRDRIWSVDPDVPVTRIVSFDALMSDAVDEERYRARLMIAFGVLAGLFAMLGVYGVTARTVARRTREFGIRMALGARGAEVLALVVRQGTRLAAAGVALGLLASLFATRLVEDLLFGIHRLDPWSLTGIALLVGGVSIAASLGPGRKALAVDPQEALRTE